MGGTLDLRVQVPSPTGTSRSASINGELPVSNDCSLPLLCHFHQCQCHSPQGPHTSHAARRTCASRGSRHCEGRYLVDNHLFGKGTFGVVHRGWDKVTGEMVAVKQLSLQAGCDEQALSRFVSNEASAMLRLAGFPNIIGIRAHLKDRACHSIVMDAATGGELFERVSASVDGLAEEEARLIFGQMVEGAAGMHRRGVAHRDLKLENAVFDSAGRLFWIDFGLAHVYLPSAGASSGAGSAEAEFDFVGVGNAVGSESYMSPELAALRKRMGRTVDARKADVWALGVCLFAMASGFFPFTNADSSVSKSALTALATAQREGRCGIAAIFRYYGRACAFSQPLATLLNELLAVDPERRLPLLLPWSSWLSCSPVAQQSAKWVAAPTQYLQPAATPGREANRHRMRVATTMTRRQLSKMGWRASGMPFVEVQLASSLSC